MNKTPRLKNVIFSKGRTNNFLKANPELYQPLGL